MSNVARVTRETLCSCGKENRQPGQRYGKRCHAKAQAKYRARQAEKHAADHRAHLALIAAAVRERAGTPL